MSDDEKTPVHTPSARLRLGLERCPACGGTGLSTVGETCFFCDGGKCVSNEKADEWRLAHLHETPVPDTEPEDSRG